MVEAEGLEPSSLSTTQEAATCLSCILSLHYNLQQEGYYNAQLLISLTSRLKSLKRKASLLAASDSTPQAGQADGSCY
jgi:hypothetical protein